MKKVALSKIKDDLSRYLRLAEKEQVVITRHGKPAGILIGFKSEDDWLPVQFIGIHARRVPVPVLKLPHVHSR